MGQHLSDLVIVKTKWVNFFETECTIDCRIDIIS